jgi:hypothetical protein
MEKKTKRAHEFLLNQNTTNKPSMNIGTRKPRPEACSYVKYMNNGERPINPDRTQARSSLRPNDLKSMKLPRTVRIEKNKLNTKDIAFQLMPVIIWSSAYANGVPLGYERG